MSMSRDIRSELTVEESQAVWEMARRRVLDAHRDEVQAWYEKLSKTIIELSNEKQDVSIS